MKYTPEFLEILKLVAPLIIGIILGFLGNRYQMNNGKETIKRERRLKNIAKIEQILSYIKDIEFALFRLNMLSLENDKLGKRDDELGRLIKKIGEKIDRGGNRVDELKIRFEELDKLKGKVKTIIKKSQNKKSLETIEELDKMEKALLQDKESVILELQQAIDECTEYTNEVKENVTVLKKNVVEIDSIKTTIENFQPNLYRIDADAISRIVDPSGKLSSMLSELILMQAIDSDSAYKQKVNLRIKIENLLEQKIK